jgi:dTDP-4-amino-4,6-dideoxygalactose transaminase
MIALGNNYRLSDIACALGASQLRKLPANLARRRQLAARYSAALADVAGLRLPTVRGEVEPAWHLYVIRLLPEALRAERDEVLAALRAENIGVNVHYIPVHTLHYYRERFGYKGGEYPVAETAHAALLTLPLFPAMTDGDAHDVIAAVRKVFAHFRR